MPNRTGPSTYGARAARELLLQIKRTNLRNGAPDLEAAASLIDSALADPRSRRGVLLALSEYLSVALEGSTIRPETWTPLQYADPRTVVVATPIRKF